MNNSEQISREIYRVVRSLQQHRNYINSTFYRRFMNAVQRLRRTGDRNIELEICAMIIKEYNDSILREIIN